MKFGEMCGPLQLYVLICLISLVLQLHNTYTTKSLSWVNQNKTAILIAIVFNFVLFVFWGRVILSLCKTNNKGMAWILIFAPVVMSLFVTFLMVSGAIVNKATDEVGRLL
jgi:hypothetical protein